MSISGYLAAWCSSLLSLSKMSSELHLWYAVKSPLLFLHPDNTFFLPLEASAPTFNFQIITQPPQHEAVFSAPLLWASGLNEIFSSRTVHKLESCPVSTLIGQWRLFASSTVSCVSSLKGERSQSLGRDQPPHQSWLPQPYLSLTPGTFFISQLTPHWLFSFSLMDNTCE